MEDKFLEFIAEIMRVDRELISLDTAYGELEVWDSLMFMRLVMELEEEYDIMIPMEQFNELKKLDDFYQLIGK